jgi:hypothetical protein
MMLPLVDQVEIAEQARLRVLLLKVLVVPGVLGVVVERVDHVVTSPGILFEELVRVLVRRFQELFEVEACSGTELRF